MKILILGIGCFGCNLLGASFVNLGFESPKLPLTQDPEDLYARVPIGRALPGWVAYTGTSIENRILYHSSFLGSAGLELRDDTFKPNGKINYSVMFYSGGSLHGEGGVPTGIFQTGDVPASAKTLLFQGETTFSEPRLDYRVTLDGVTLSLQVVTEGTFGADISAFAGRTAELRFQANYRADRHFPQVYFPLDDIRFSSVALVPEPSTLALVGFGGLALWMLRGLHRS